MIRTCRSNNEKRQSWYLLLINVRCRPQWNYLYITWWYINIDHLMIYKYISLDDIQNKIIWYCLRLLFLWGLESQNYFQATPETCIPLLEVFTSMISFPYLQSYTAFPHFSSFLISILNNPSRFYFTLSNNIWFLFAYGRGNWNFLKVFIFSYSTIPFLFFFFLYKSYIPFHSILFHIDYNR